jgi:hypothetical protein
MVVGFACGILPKVPHRLNLRYFDTGSAVWGVTKPAGKRLQELDPNQN